MRERAADLASPDEGDFWTCHVWKTFLNKRRAAVAQPRGGLTRSTGPFKSPRRTAARDA
jgi:hypothetical protein